MKKKVIIISILLILAIAIAILLMPCDHEWMDATCTEAKTCSKCQETEGDPLGHDWVDASCEKPKTCKICNEISGDPLGHDWTPATCQTPKTCSVCWKTEGNANPHNYVPDTMFDGHYNICSYCEEYEPNIVCPNCNWGTFETGVGIEGVTCSDCGYKII